jgi:hypothetical protein
MGHCQGQAGFADTEGAGDGDKAQARPLEELAQGGYFLFPSEEGG